MERLVDNDHSEFGTCNTLKIKMTFPRRPQQVPMRVRALYKIRHRRHRKQDTGDTGNKKQEIQETEHRRHRQPST